MELLIVISVIGILAGLLFPSMAKVKERSRRTTCRSQLRQIGLAFELYTVDHDGMYPCTGDSYLLGKESTTDYTDYAD